MRVCEVRLELRQGLNSFRVSSKEYLDNKRKFDPEMSYEWRRGLL